MFTVADTLRVFISIYIYLFTNKAGLKNCAAHRRSKYLFCIMTTMPPDWTRQSAGLTELSLALNYSDSNKASISKRYATPFEYLIAVSQTPISFQNIDRVSSSFTAIMTSTIGIPIKLLNEAQVRTGPILSIHLPYLCSRL